MISIQHKTIFIHIPKCAGQSIEETFLKDISPDLNFEQHRHLIGCFQRPASWNEAFPNRLAHLTADQYQSLSFVSPSMWNSYYKFAIIRDPIDRCISMFRYLGQYPHDFQKFVFDFLPQALAKQHFFFKPQVDYLIDSKTNQIIVDEIIPFKELNNLWVNIQEKSKIATPLIKRNVSIHKNKPEISLEIEKQIKSLYADDYKKLGEFF